MQLTKYSFVPQGSSQWTHIISDTLRIEAAQDRLVIFNGALSLQVLMVAAITRATVNYSDLSIRWNDNPPRKIQVRFISNESCRKCVEWLEQCNIPVHIAEHMERKNNHKIVAISSSQPENFQSQSMDMNTSITQLLYTTTSNDSSMSCLTDVQPESQNVYEYKHLSQQSNIEFTLEHQILSLLQNNEFCQLVERVDECWRRIGLDYSNSDKT